MRLRMWRARRTKASAVVAVVAALTMSVSHVSAQNAGPGPGMSVGPGAAMANDQFTAEVDFGPHGSVWWPVTTSYQDITYRLRNTGTTTASGQITVLVDEMFSRQNQVGEARSFTLAPGQVLTGALRADSAPFFVMRPTVSVTSGAGSPGVSVTPDTPQWVVPWALVIVPLLVLVAVVSFWSWRRSAGIPLFRRSSATDEVVLPEECIGEAVPGSGPEPLPETGDGCPEDGRA